MKISVATEENTSTILGAINVKHYGLESDWFREAHAICEFHRECLRLYDWLQIGITSSLGMHHCLCTLDNSLVDKGAFSPYVLQQNKSQTVRM